MNSEYQTPHPDPLVFLFRLCFNDHLLNLDLMLLQRHPQFYQFYIKEQIVCTGSAVLGAMESSHVLKC